MKGTVLVTGSSRGIGKGIALRLAQDGYDIVLHCRTNIDEAESVADQIRDSGRSVRVLQFDIANRDQAREVLEQDTDEFAKEFVLLDRLVKCNHLRAMLKILQFRVNPKTLGLAL